MGVPRRVENVGNIVIEIDVGHGPPQDIESDGASLLQRSVSASHYSAGHMADHDRPRFRHLLTVSVLPICVPRFVYCACLSLALI